MKKKKYSYRFLLVAGIGVGNSTLRSVFRNLARTSHRANAISLDPRWFPRDVRLANAE